VSSESQAREHRNQHQRKRFALLAHLRRPVCQFCQLIDLMTWGAILCHADALGSLAPHLSPEQIGEVLAAAKAIGDEGSRARARGSLAPYISPIHRGTLLNSLIATAARLPRGQALQAVSASVQVSAAIGGIEGLAHIRRAISGTAQWDP
jgi:hypothetical protein